jgi:pimeloyl-ACP methyl ester carboxylesterase
MVRDVPALLDHLQIDKTHLAGYSLGGFISLKACTLYPERISRAVILASGWVKPEDETLFHNLDQWANDFLKDTPYQSVLTVLGDATGLPNRFETWVEYQFIHRMNDRHALHAVVKSLHTLAINPSELAQLVTPLRLIIGETDPLLDSAQTLAEQFDRIDFHVLKKSGHTGLACRKKAATLLIEWLASE